MQEPLLPNMDPAQKRCPGNRKGSFASTIFSILSDPLEWEELHLLKKTVIKNCIIYNVTKIMLSQFIWLVLLMV